MGLGYYERKTLDLLRGIAVLRQETNVGDIAVFGRGAEAAVAVFAAILDPAITEVVLADPVTTHLDGGPEFLGVLKTGDLVETAHTADEPTFTARGIMVREWGKKPAFSDYGPLPAIRSYAFRNDAQRGLILFNFDTEDAHTVKPAFPDAAKDRTARAWRLAADAVAADNEYETGEPQVRIVEETLRDFAPGVAIELPPHSMLVLKWEREE